MKYCGVLNYFKELVVPVLLLSMVCQIASAEFILKITAEDETALDVFAFNQSVTVQDNAGFDQDLAAGAVGFSGPIGNFTVHNVIGLSKPILGLASFPFMDIFGAVSSKYTGSFGGRLTIALTDTDFTGPLPGANFLSSIGGTKHGTIEYNTYLDLGNLEFGTDALIGSLDFLTNDVAFSGATTFFAATDDLYSMTMELVITHGPSRSSGSYIQPTLTSFDAEFSDPIPEPYPILLMGLALLALRANKKTGNCNI